MPTKFGLAPGGGFHQQTPGGEKAKTGPGGSSAIKPAD
jgi:hypothetical protein